MIWIKPGQSFFCSSSSCDENLDSEFMAAIKLRHYKCDGTFAYISYPITEPEDILNALSNTKRTIFYIFGFTQSADHDDTKSIISALCDEGKDNVVVLDWSKYSDFHSLFSYPLSVFPNAQKTGKAFAKCLGKLMAAGLDPSQIYVIGFSAGAHIAGLAGRCNKDFKIPRITGLDPANPFTSLFAGCYLSSDNALSVDVIHTDMGLYGTTDDSPETATAHFFANGGHRFQPKCPSGLSIFPFSLTLEEFCSHTSAIQYYIETVKNPNKYMATCRDLSQCEGEEHQPVGYNANNVKGKYDFKTV